MMAHTPFASKRRKSALVFRQTLLATLVALQCGSLTWAQTASPFNPVVPVVAPVSTPFNAPASVPAAASAAATPPTVPIAAAPPATAPVVVAPAPLAPPPAGVGMALRFDNADIYDVIQVVLGEILKVDYVIEPAVQGRVTLRSTSAVQTADLVGVLETALAQVGVSLVRSGSTYKVMRDVQAAREPLPSNGVGESALVMRVIPLRFVQAAQIAATLKPFASAGGAMIPDPTNKYLLVVDRNSVVDRLAALVETLDSEFLRNIHVRLLRPQHADPIEVGKELDALIKTSGLFNLSNTDPVKAFVLPVPRLSAVMVASPSTILLEAVDKWFAMLDAAPDKDADAMVHVYAVANANAMHLANILQQVISGQASAGGGQATASRTSSATSSTTGQASNPLSPGGAGQPAQTGQSSNFGINTAGMGGGSISRGNVPTSAGVGISSATGFAGAVSIIPDEVTNTIIIKASAADYQRIQAVLRKIDTQPRQVLIQVVVAEVTLNDTLQYGVEWWLNSTVTKNGKTWAAKAGLEGLIKAPSASGVVSGVGSGFNYTIFNGSSQVIGLLNLLGQDTKVNLLSAPHVLATDGKIARVEIGNDEPIVTQTVQTPGTLTSTLTTSNSVQYRPTGIILEVKPSISSNGLISLSIAQEVSNRAATVAVGGSEYPSFSKRRVSTDVSVQDGKTLLIAGLIEDKGDDTSVGLPTLKDIPLFGALFGTNKKVNNKTELLITITPHVVNSYEDADRLKADFMNSVKQLGALIERRPGV